MNPYLFGKNEIYLRWWILGILIILKIEIEKIIKFIKKNTGWR